MAKNIDNDVMRYSVLGRHIKERRTEMKMTQEALSEKLDITAGHLGRIERGERTLNFQRLGQICKLLNVPAEKLLAGCIQGIESSASDKSIGERFESLLKGSSEQAINLALNLCKEIVNTLR